MEVMITARAPSAKSKSQILFHSGAERKFHEKPLGGCVEKWCGFRYGRMPLRDGAFSAGSERGTGKEPYSTIACLCDGSASPSRRRRQSPERYCDLGKEQYVVTSPVHVSGHVLTRRQLLHGCDGGYKPVPGRRCVRDSHLYCSIDLRPSPGRGELRPQHRYHRHSAGQNHV